MKKSESYLFLCFGKSYILDCQDTIETLRSCGDLRPVAIVILPEDLLFAKTFNIFNKIHIFDIKNHELFNTCKTNFERFCLLPRLELYKYLTTDYTMVLDTDILCSHSTDEAWNFLINKNQDLIMLGSKNNPSWHWGYWGEICSKIDIKPQETHGGLFFIRKTNNLKRIFDDARECFVNYDNFGMLRFYQNGAVDEPCFSYAFSKNKFQPVEFSEFPIMTFNLNSEDSIPTKKMTEVRQARFMEEYIPFIHMFEKNHGENFLAIKEKIIKNASIYNKIIKHKLF
jgi:hypothetical protein